jgi:hypothetical protein
MARKTGRASARSGKSKSDVNAPKASSITTNKADRRATSKRAINLADLPSSSTSHQRPDPVPPESSATALLKSLAMLQTASSNANLFDLFAQMRENAIRQHGNLLAVRLHDAARRANEGGGVGSTPFDQLVHFKDADEWASSPVTMNVAKAFIVSLRKVIKAVVKAATAISKSVAAGGSGPIDSLMNPGSLRHSLLIEAKMEDTHEMLAGLNFAIADIRVDCADDIRRLKDLHSWSTTMLRQLQVAMKSKVATIGGRNQNNALPQIPLEDPYRVAEIATMLNLDSGSLLRSLRRQRCLIGGPRGRHVASLSSFYLVLSPDKANQLRKWHKSSR